MPDREKVTYDIERCICRVPDACRDCSHYQDDRLDCMEKLLADALALLKEQEAVEPIRKKLKFSETWECGNCHEELFEGEVIRDNYCPNCGRAVKWE